MFPIIYIGNIMSGFRISVMEKMGNIPYNIMMIEEAQAIIGLGCGASVSSSITSSFKPSGFKPTVKRMATTWNKKSLNWKSETNGDLFQLSSTK